jgi:pyroglutamyl-peptidase
MLPKVILVTGFGAFPGAPHNPTELLIDNLAAHEKPLAQLGIRLERQVLPVVYDEIAPKLESLIAAKSPDVVLHFGLAGRRRAISIETRAQNRLCTDFPDAAGKYAGRCEVLSGGPAVLRATVPVSAFAAALREAGIRCRPSRDAGDYICNQTFYLSLAMARGRDRNVGFIHVPQIDPQTLVDVALLLIAALPGHLRET